MEDALTLTLQNGRSPAAVKLWASLSRDQVDMKTWNGLSKINDNIAAADQQVSEHAASVATMLPTERWKCVVKYEKRIAMRKSRGTSSSSCPSTDAIACKILELYQNSPETRLSDCESCPARSTAMPSCASKSSRSRDAALVRWEGTSKEERVSSTSTGLSAGKMERRRKADDLFQDLKTKLDNGSLSPKERLETVEKYKNRLRRRKSTSVEEPICPKLDELARFFLGQYEEDAALRMADLAFMRTSKASK